MKSLVIPAALIFLFFFSVNAVGQFDYGDAPDPTYPTLSASNGANHLLSPLFFGTLVDAELNGQPNINANGDDQSSLMDDEDGIDFKTWIIPAASCTVDVTVSAGGFVDAWIDFNGNGSWIDPGEQIFLSQPVVAGNNTLNFIVPPGASAGIYTYARFRCSSIGGLSYTGMALDGEVEDMQVVISQPNIGNPIMDIDPGLSFAQNEISMGYDHYNGLIMAAYNDHPIPGGPGIGISSSSDYGQSWTSQQLPIPSNSIGGGSMVDAFDPSLAFDDSSNVFVAHIATDFNLATGPVTGLFVHKSSDGGLTWSAPVAIDVEAGAVSNPDSNYRFNDRCQIIVDKNTSSPFYNRIYVVWLKDRGFNQALPYSDVYVSYSSDGGASFSSAKQVNAKVNDLGNLPIATVASNGDLYFLWMDYNVNTGGQGRMFLSRSSDGGVTWSGDSLVDKINLPPLNLNSGIDVRAKGAAIIRASVKDSNTLFICYAADPDSLGSDEADIYFIKSTDAGNSWSSPIRVNDDVTTNDQVLPWMEVANCGTIDLVWYDRRNDVNDLTWDVYASTSTDEGASFSANQKVNAQSFASPQTAVGPWFGEYLGLAVSDSMAYVGFCTSAIDLQGDVAFAKFKNPEKSCDTCCLLFVSDSSWRQSTEILMTNYSGSWSGLNTPLPHDSTFTETALLGQPYPWNHINEVEGSSVIKAGNNIRFYRKTFGLNGVSVSKMRLSMNVDDQAEIYLNDNLLVRINQFGRMNFKNPYHDAIFEKDSATKNGYLSGDSFDYLSSKSLSSLLVDGENELIFAIRNRGKASDKGGFNFRLDINDCQNIQNKAGEYLEQEAIDGFELFPNPGNNRVTVYYPNYTPNHKLVIELYDLNGQLLMKNLMQSAFTEVDVSALPKGIYVVDVKSEGYFFTRKFTKL